MFCFLFLFFVLLASPKKQTNRKNIGRGHRNSCGQLQRARILIKKKTNIKRHRDKRKTTATYNKLLDETRDKHYYISNRETHNHRKQLTRTYNNLKKPDLEEAKVDELKSTSSARQFQILLLLMRKDVWYVVVLHFLIMHFVRG